MARSILFFIITLMIAGCQKKEPADLIIYHANIYTVDDKAPKAEAVAVAGGRIIAVGDYGEVMLFKGDHTALVDLQGLTMTPGFVEGHGHFMGMGYSLINLDLLNTMSYSAIVEKVKEAADQAAPGTWITGRGWHQSKWDSLPEKMVKGFPTHDLLSAVSPDNPVYLSHASGHAALVNAKAMEIAGVDKNTGDVAGGEIIRDDAGMPTGVFNETAAGLIASRITDNNKSSDRKAYTLATENCLKEGITSFHDAGADQETIDLYRDMIDKDEACIRLYVMLDGSNRGLISRHMEKGPYIDTLHQLLTIRAIKLYADGALGSRGAWLLEPYADRAGHTGHATSPMALIREVSKMAIDAGFQVCTHAIGDRANHEVLDIYEAVTEGYVGIIDHRYRIEHAQHLSEADIPRFAGLGVIPAMQAIHMASDRPWAIDRLGPERIEKGAYVWQKLLQSGATIVNGTDVPVEPLSPVACFYASVTRKTLAGEPEGGYEPEQRMTREQALRSYTLNAAYGAFEETIKGSIEPGKLADFTVFNKDLMTVPDDELLTARVLMTIIGGRILYDKRK